MCSCNKIAMLVSSPVEILQSQFLLSDQHQLHQNTLFYPHMMKYLQYHPMHCTCNACIHSVTQFHIIIYTVYYS